MPITQEHKNILASQSANKTLPEWVEYFNNEYTKNQIYSYCYHNGYNIKKLCAEEKSKIQSKNARKYHINQDFFKTWSRDMAYILGYWWADGCIYKGQMFDITTHAKDKYILKRMAEKLQYEGPIQDYVNRQAYRINFSCVVIYRDIVALGGSERKSLTAVFPNVPKEFLPDFIRGYFDGDGSVWFVKGGPRINSEFCSGSKDFLLKLWDILKQEAGIEGGNLHLCNASCYELIFGKRDSIKLGKFMYKENPELFLLRKKDKFKDFLNK